MIRGLGSYHQCSAQVVLYHSKKLPGMTLIDQPSFKMVISENMITEGGYTLSI